MLLLSLSRKIKYYVTIIKKIEPDVNIKNKEIFDTFAKKLLNTINQVQFESIFKI